MQIPMNENRDIQIQNLLSNFIKSSASGQKISIARRIKKLVGSSDLLPAHRIAIIGTGSLTELSNLILADLLACDISADLYVGEYNSVHDEILRRDSGLYQFQPTIVLILSNHRNISLTDIPKSEVEIDSLIESEMEIWQLLWRTVTSHTGAVVIQNNFDTPDIRVFGNLSKCLPHSVDSYIARFNHRFVASLPDNVVLHDLAHLAAYHGLRRWHDPRFYYHSKHPCSLDLLPAYSESLTTLIQVMLGKVKKCLVLDLDNTIWGGVIGDDGLNGIEIGQGSPLGEAHLALQQYALDLKQRGILLAVCSKNTENIAKLPFESHPDMLLRLDDIAYFVANWEPKPDNLKRISEQLNIGLNSLVFVDDNPTERAIVREFLPDVCVPELPLDPAYYVRTLNEGGYFETVTYSSEDAHRTEMYKANSTRQLEAMSTNDMDSFLRSLQMKATIVPFLEEDLERITQLVSRSNQFNVTTRRHTKADLRTFMESADYVTFSMRLKDRFGDNGLIAVWIGKILQDLNTVEIDTWLMSCRVLSKGAEEHLRNHIVKHLQEKNYNTVVGVYKPTPKNVLVSGLYPRLGFDTQTVETESENRWELDLNNCAIIETQIETVVTQ